MANENRRVIEDYGEYSLAFAEFDDQGWSYDADRQLTFIRDRLAQELKDPAYLDWDFVVVVFTHGWHHNAYSNDCNVQEARQMLLLASKRFEDAVHQGKFHRHRRVFGIYVGWRGESVDAALLRYATVIDREDAAEKVAKGSVRQLLADLHQQQLIARAAAAADPNRQTPDHKPNPIDVAARMYTIVVGHSFGGLIVFNALSQQLINDLTAAADNACTPGGVTGASQTWPDSVVLINPAFEASRLEPLNRLADRAAACHYRPIQPLLTVITADNDRWTGPVFTAGRRLQTLFDKYDDSGPSSRAAERDANVHAIGFVNRYRTHRLCLWPPDGEPHATVSVDLTPVSTADPSTVSHRAVWVVGAPKEIVDGHNGFLYARTRGRVPQPYLLDWLVATHVDPATANSGPGICGPWHWPTP